jgi:hypothetical protein
MKRTIIKYVPILSFCLVMAVLLDYALINLIMFVQDPLQINKLVDTNTSIRIDKRPIKLWVLETAVEAGLDPAEVACIIQHESNWKADAIGTTKDIGLWQINIMHKKSISVPDMLDYKKATRWSIAKRLHDGNWGAWVGWNNCR